MTTTSATDSQVTYIATLAAQVEDKYGYASIASPLYRATQAARHHGLTKREASRTIDALKEMVERDLDLDLAMAAAEPDDDA